MQRKFYLRKNSKSYDDDDDDDDDDDKFVPYQSKQKPIVSMLTSDKDALSNLGDKKKVVSTLGSL